MYLKKKRNYVASQFAWVFAWNCDKDSPEDIIKCGQNPMIDFSLHWNKVHKHEAAHPHEML